MNLPNLFFIDFDGTLFHTEAFWDAVRKKTAVQIGITETHFTETYQQSKHAGTGYDIDAHLSLLGISRADFVGLCTSVLTQTSYAFPDASTFIRNHLDDTVVILTQGIEWFQRAKIASLPKEWHDIRSIVVGQKKRLYIEERIGFYEDGILFEGNHYKSLTFVDNMADAFLPEEHGAVFRQYRIVRPGDPYGNVPTPQRITEITTLNLI